MCRSFIHPAGYLPFSFFVGVNLQRDQLVIVSKSRFMHAPVSICQCQVIQSFRRHGVSQIGLQVS